MTFVDRLRLLVDDKAGGNKAEFARLCGLDEGSVRQYLAGTKPTLDKLVSIAQGCRVSLDWLVLGTESENSTTPVGLTVGIQKLAFRASAGAGSLVLQDEPMLIPLPTTLLQEIGLNPEVARAIEAQGDSMSPTIQDGDLILVNIGDRDLRDGKIYVFTIGDEAFLKRLRRARGKVMMVSDNPTFPQEPIPPGESISIVGRVVWGGRRL